MTTDAPPLSLIYRPWPKVHAGGGRRGKFQRVGLTHSESEPRPSIPMMLLCAECGADAKVDGRGRGGRCIKCGSHAFETIPARFLRLPDSDHPLGQSDSTLSLSPSDQPVTP